MLTPYRGNWVVKTFVPPQLTAPTVHIWPLVIRLVLSALVVGLSIRRPSVLSSNDALVGRGNIAAAWRFARRSFGVNVGSLAPNVEIFRAKI